MEANQITEDTKDKKVLVVGESQELLEKLEFCLQGLSCQLVYAKGGREAFQLLKTYKYDMVISDTCMSGGDGVELLQAVRAEDDEIPIMFLFSADPERPELDKELLFLLGADLIATKPLNLKHTRSTVKQVVLH